MGRDAYTDRTDQASSFETPAAQAPQSLTEKAITDSNFCRRRAYPGDLDQEGTASLSEVAGTSPATTELDLLPFPASCTGSAIRLRRIARTEVTRASSLLAIRRAFVKLGHGAARRPGDDAERWDATHTLIALIRPHPSRRLLRRLLRV